MMKLDKNKLIKTLQNKKLSTEELMKIEYETITNYGIEGLHRNYMGQFDRNFQINLWLTFFIKKTKISIQK